MGWKTTNTFDLISCYVSTVKYENIWYDFKQEALFSFSSFINQHLHLELPPKDFF